MTELSTAKLQTIVWTSDIPRAEEFYSRCLGLPLLRQSHGALVYQVGNGELRVSPVPSTQQSEHTVFGFEVGEVDGVVELLSAKGLAVERFEGFNHATNGVWTAADGTKVAWFRDPDGNLFSIVSYV